MLGRAFSKKKYVSWHWAAVSCVKSFSDGHLIRIRGSLFSIRRSAEENWLPFEKSLNLHVYGIRVRICCTQRQNFREIAVHRNVSVYEHILHHFAEPSNSFGDKLSSMQFCSHPSPRSSTVVKSQCKPFSFQGMFFFFRHLRQVEVIRTKNDHASVSAIWNLPFHSSTTCMRLLQI